MKMKYMILGATLVATTAVPVMAHAKSFVAEGVVDSVEVGDGDGGNDITVTLANDNRREFRVHSSNNLNNTQGTAILQLLTLSRSNGATVTLSCAATCGVNMFDTVKLD